jgi:DNA repair photolyase
VLLRLPHELRQIFEEWLQRHYPDRAARVLSLIRQTRGGKLYDADFERRQKGEGAYAEILARRFEVAMTRCGLQRRSEEMEKLSVTGFDGRADDPQGRLI